MIGGIAFAAPWALAALVALPVLYWLLRVTPPAPRQQSFPAIRLLAGLRPPEETPARTPWWLLALRLLAAGLLILGLARPVIEAGSLPGGAGPVLLVVDDGWASAPDWPARLAAAQGVLDRAEREGRRAALLPTAPSARDEPPRITAVMPAVELRARVAALRPLPWAPDRAGAAAALRGWTAPGTTVAWIADGVAHDEGAAPFRQELARIGGGLDLRGGRVPLLLLPPRTEAERLILRVAAGPADAPVPVAVIARAADGRAVARAELMVPPAGVAEAPLLLPPELRNRIARLEIEGPPAVGGVVLLDDRWRRRPVGLLAPDAGAETPFVGDLFFLARALSPGSELRRGDVAALLAREIAVIVAADRPLADATEQAALAAWVERGGTLVRFAGSRLADAPDPLLPVTLRAGDRTLGGALSWSQPARLAPFASASPFASLPIPEDVVIERQVLAEPGPLLADRTWARLADGTPVVTAQARGAGRIVLFHVTANAEWSNLPLSGLFVEMMNRIVGLSAGVVAADGDTLLAPAELLDGLGRLQPPPPAAVGLRADRIAETSPGPRHPPGLYGTEAQRRALNLSAALPPPAALAPAQGARAEDLAGIAADRLLGPWLVAAALLLVLVDLLVSLGLRGLMRPATAGLALLLLAAPPARAQEMPALSTRLAYVVTGDAAVDETSRLGLAGLSDYVTRRTAATLTEPSGIVPGRDPLEFYPLLYWPLTDGQAPPDSAAVAALNAFMRDGGIILFDTRSDLLGEGFSGSTSAALRRLTQGLIIPPLAQMPADHVIARAFYLLQEFPGRTAGGTVWVARETDRANDSVSPVVVGAADWAAAWAVDGQGRNPFATVPGGARQRTLAYRFGVNLVMYALTGNYKGDQVHVPAILERLGN